MYQQSVSMSLYAELDFFFLNPISVLNDVNIHHISRRTHTEADARFPEQRNVGAVGTVGRFRCRLTELSKINGAAAPAAAAVVANMKMNVHR